MKIRSLHILFFILFYFIATFLYPEGIGNRIYYSFGMLVIFIISVFLNFTSIKTRDILIKNLISGFGLSCSLLLVYILVMMLAYVDDYSISFGTNLNYFFMSAGSFLTILALLANLKGNEAEKRLMSFFIMVLSILALYKIYSIRDLMLLNNSSSLVTNLALVPASLFPFVFYIKKPWMRFTLLTVVLIAAMLGNKRSGLIGIGLSSAMIGLYIILFRREMINLRYIFILLISSFLIYLSYYLYSDIYLNSYLRIINISEDGGSGRIGIWSEIKHYLDLASGEKLFFGGGSNYYHVAINHNYSSPHNDFLELVLSYGIFGLSFYLFFLLRIIYFVFIHIKSRSELAIFSISLFFMFLVMSNVSGVFIYSTSYMAFFIAFAILESNQRKKFAY